MRHFAANNASAWIPKTEEKTEEKTMVATKKNVAATTNAVRRTTKAMATVTT